jgi:hypothetical protein
VPCIAAVDAVLVRAETMHIAIDVRVDGDEIRGEARDDTDQATPFVGWLGLIVALDRLLGGPTFAARAPIAPD